MEITEKQLEKLEEQLGILDDVKRDINNLRDPSDVDLYLDDIGPDTDEDDIPGICEDAVKTVLEDTMNDLKMDGDKIEEASREIKWLIEDVRMAEERAKPLALAS